MPVVLQRGSIKYRINANDHSPLHVHIEFKDAEVVVDLTDLTVLHIRGVRGKRLKLILNDVKTNREALLEAWESLRD